MTVDFEVDRYLIETEIGRGGMGVVYRATDKVLSRSVAVKLLTEAGLEDAAARTRFQHEIASAVAIEHPHVVPIYDAGYDGHHFFIAMRLIEGPDLADAARQQGALPEARVMRLVGQIASALYSMHAQGMVHRDVKPQNVLVWGEGSTDEHAMLTDFGIAKAIDETGTLSRAGPIGTPAYMAPEVCLGETAGPRSDQYSLACLTYQLLTGALPFDADAGLMRDAHISADPKPFGSEHPVSSETREAVMRAMSKSPAGRFDDVRGLVRTPVAERSFVESQAITTAAAKAGNPEELAEVLVTELGLSDTRTHGISGLEKSRVARLRRKAAREALVGKHHSRVIRETKPGGNRPA